MVAVGFAVRIEWTRWCLRAHRVLAACPGCGEYSQIEHAVDDLGYVSIVCPHCHFRDWIVLEGWDLDG